MRTNPLDSLSEAQQESIFLYTEELSEASVLKFVSGPPPNGMGIEVSRAGLHAFVQRKKRERMMREAKEALEEAERLASSEGNESKVDQATLEMLRRRLFEQATEEMKPSELLAMYKTAQQTARHKEEMELARRKMQATEEQVRVARERLQLSAAKLALAHAGELRGLITEGEVGDGEKLQGALARLFGEKFAKAAKAIPEGSGK